VPSVGIGVPALYVVVVHSASLPKESEIFANKAGM
jgi:hypothetical protein